MESELVALICFTLFLCLIMASVGWFCYCVGQRSTKKCRDYTYYRVSISSTEGY